MLAFSPSVHEVCLFYALSVEATQCTESYCRVMHFEHTLRLSARRRWWATVMFFKANISSLPHWQRHSMKCVFLYGTHSLYISIYDQREWAQDRNFNVTSSLKLPRICWIKSLSLFLGGCQLLKTAFSVYSLYVISTNVLHKRFCKKIWTFDPYSGTN